MGGLGTGATGTVGTYVGDDDGIEDGALLTVGPAVEGARDGDVEGLLVGELVGLGVVGRGVVGLGVVGRGVVGRGVAGINNGTFGAIDGWLVADIVCVSFSSKSEKSKRSSSSPGTAESLDATDNTMIAPTATSKTPTPTVYRRLFLFLKKACHFPLLFKHRSGTF